MAAGVFMKWKRIRLKTPNQIWRIDIGVVENMVLTISYLF